MNECGTKALKLFAEEFRIDLRDDVLLLSKLYSNGSGVGNRCAVLQSAYLMNGILNGRLTASESRNFLKKSSDHLYKAFMDTFQNENCSVLCNDIKDDHCPIWNHAVILMKEKLKEIMDEKRNLLIQKFKVHERLNPFVDYILNDNDWEMIACSDDQGYLPNGRFTQAELEKGYKRGVLNKEKIGNDIVYKIGTCHKRVDCFMRGELDSFNALPSHVRNEIVEYEQDIRLWVLPYRKEGVNMKIVNPVPIEKALEIVDASNARFWVQQCDCKTYRYDENHLTETCIHFMNEDSILNSNFDRGYARELSKDETKELLLKIDKDGLVHNYAHDSFCNCCNCCCWAMRGMQKYRELGYDVFKEYVNAEYLISINSEKCTGCGACTAICPAKALLIKDKKVQLLDHICLGCGVCRTRCKAEALVIKKR